MLAVSRVSFNQDYSKVNIPRKNVQASFGMNIPQQFIQSQPLRKTALRALASISNVSGEKTNIIIDSFGKLLIAPAVIFFNPFLRTSEENKKFTAGKQVVSAAFTIVSQLGINVTAEKLLTKLAKANKLGPAFNLNTQSQEALKLSQKRLKLLNDKVGLLVTLAVIPLIVKATNWVYPRIMKKLLSNKMTETKCYDD
ncbi:MAG: hypothetical protein ACD_20C00350G0026 [uncultured bacterium]|nr:MAG: hypothetical protein ACD_20C00350G0026 [uncultured bacterium]HBH17722.1 hypothetical protein [Cyanobacteria bacterium UBA9579]